MLLECEQDTVEWLFRAFERMHHNYIKQELTRRGFGMASHPRILFMLKSRPGHTASQKQLADFVGISPPTAAVSIRRMQKAGLLRRVEDTRDRRRKLVTFTAKGLRAVLECETVFDRTDHAVFEGFSEQEIELLKEFYRRMLKNLKNLGAQPPTLPKRSSDS